MKQLNATTLSLLPIVCSTIELVALNGSISADVSPFPLDPIIFRGLKSLTLSEPQHESLLRLAQEGISVYSPHTAVDATPGGMADWLCDIVTGSETESRSEFFPPAPKTKQPSATECSYSRPSYPRIPSDSIN